MDRKTIKGFISGILVGGIVMTSIPAFAQPVEKQLNAIFNGIKIYVDGKKVDAVDANGQNIEPFIYNGTTYLPVRAIGQAFNSNVDWDGKTSTVYVGKSILSDVDVDLSALDYLSETHMKEDYGYPDAEKKLSSNSSISLWTEDDKDNTGTSYENGLKFNMRGSDIWDNKSTESTREYLLNGKYAKFDGNFVLHYDSRTSNYVSSVLKVYGDDKLLYTSSDLEEGTLPQKFSIDTEGVIKLKITIANTTKNAGFRGTTQVGIVNAGFIKS
jgi:hypothetical protein